VGYEVYTPFFAQGATAPLLIDRGFVPLEQNRSILPTLRPIEGEVTITGMLNLPPTYFSLGAMLADGLPTWPLRVEYIDLNKLSDRNKFFPYVLMITRGDPAAYEVEWKAIVTMPPERHVGYAVQWFALALTLLILFFVLNRSSEKSI
jgi:surfeit locus 1 family protein